jgi:hypothetical protein
MKTSELQAGDQVRLPGGHVRTIAEVEPTNLIGTYGDPIYFVSYAEGRTKEWGHANSAIAKTDWVTVCGCGHNHDDHHSYSHVQAAFWCPACRTWC